MFSHPIGVKGTSVKGRALVERSLCQGFLGCKGVVLLWVLLVVAVVILVAVPIHYYNRGVTLQNRCDESWANVDTELKRRHELIPNLVASVKGAMKHERGVLDAVTKARAAAVATAHDARHQVDAQRPLVVALERLLAVAENYPELKTSKNFLELQQELAITEDRIQAARRFYNGNVRDYRNQTRAFPGNLFARLYGFPEIDFFEVDPIHRIAPAVFA